MPPRGPGHRAAGGPAAVPGGVPVPGRAGRRHQGPTRGRGAGRDRLAWAVWAAPFQCGPCFFPFRARPHWHGGP
ncbi:hypothetical protein CTZ40_37180 [Streptomyces rimosus]|nr:hypothetical protein CTZ40_37180 [Streptomyces rimosus]QEV79822.1 hypothetical protein CP984_37140 [Streptomyces rimosus]